MLKLFLVDTATDYWWWVGERRDRQRVAFVSSFLLFSFDVLSVTALLLSFPFLLKQFLVLSKQAIATSNKQASESKQASKQSIARKRQQAMSYLLLVVHTPWVVRIPKECIVPQRLLITEPTIKWLKRDRQRLGGQNMSNTSPVGKDPVCNQHFYSLDLWHFYSFFLQPTTASIYRCHLYLHRNQPLYLTS